MNQVDNEKWLAKYFVRHVTMRLPSRDENETRYFRALRIAEQLPGDGGESTVRLYLNTDVLHEKIDSVFASEGNFGAVGNLLLGENQADPSLEFLLILIVKHSPEEKSRY